MGWGLGSDLDPSPLIEGEVTVQCFCHIQPIEQRLVSLHHYLVRGHGFKIPPGDGFKVGGLGLRFRVSALGFQVWGARCGMQGVGCRV